MKYTEEEKKAVENIKEILSFNLRNQFLDDEADNIEILLDLLNKQEKEINRLDKDNNELKRIYKKTAEHLAKIGKTELSEYFYAQIDLVPTFYVGEIIDYYKEYYKQKEIIKKLELNIKDLKNQTQIISPLYVKENYISKETIKNKIAKLKDKEQEFTDGQGYWGSDKSLPLKIEILEELLGGN